jgi:ferritin-like metal-binding protein YciE
MDHTTHHQQGHGIDEPRSNRPGVPMGSEPSAHAGRTDGEVPRQPQRKPHPHQVERDGLTPVFGTGPAPRLASGALRRAAYNMPEHQARRWMLLMAADRVDVLEHRIPELLTGRGWDALGRQVRANPVGMLAMAFGVGFVLERTRLVQGVGSLAWGVIASDGLGRAIDRDRTDEEDQLLAWLNDAYAMEKALIPILENHAKDAARHPDVRKQDLKHLDETKQHAEDVRRCIEHLGEKPSATKKMIGRITGAMNSVATEPFEDEMMKNFLTDYATEHFEIACYKSLIVAAQEAGHPKIARVCREILEEEEEMAAWIERNLPMAVRETLAEIH